MTDGTSNQNFGLDGLTTQHGCAGPDGSAPFGPANGSGALVAREVYGGAWPPESAQPGDHWGAYKLWPDGWWRACAATNAPGERPGKLANDL